MSNNKYLVKGVLLFSIQEYMKEYRITLGESIQDRHKIYLDINYWGLLCDVSLGSITDDISVEIYRTLIQLTKDKKIICPLSYRIYTELRKQKDITRLNETARIMDLLSDSVMIISEDERINYELLYFFYNNIVGKGSFDEADVFVWTKVLFVMGHVPPEYSSMYSPQENEYIQKESFKTMWEYTFTDMIHKMGAETNEKILYRAKSTVSNINIDKVKFEYQNKSSKQVYMSEIAGTLDFHQDRIKNNFNKFATTVTRSTEKLGNNPEDDIQPIINMIYHLFDRKKTGTYLPTFDIGAKAHAEIRWNKTRHYYPNDLDDIAHMYTALPYFDYFFTERSFSALIKDMKYDEKYSCCVAHKPKEVLYILAKF